MVKRIFHFAQESPPNTNSAISLLNHSPAPTHQQARSHRELLFRRRHVRIHGGSALDPMDRELFCCAIYNESLKSSRVARLTHPTATANGRTPWFLTYSLALLIKALFER